ncbi:MAG: hypothetical protein B6243_10865 [Anaerolineaceae bacterium 4572_5.2]|nr:MAG: hypothetical protein B6243_10865 [Anaerolineaceae bacterium 4572_5.2]
MMKKHLTQIDPQIWILLAFSIFAWGPLLTPAYFFNAHDARHSIFYLVEFDQTLRDGFLWPRWSPDFAFGYGYPLFNIYAPLAIYMAEVVHLPGAPMIAAVKTIYILSTIGAGLAMYGFTRRLFGAKAGLLAGMVYMFAPFHLLEIYVRSAYAEYVSLMWLPLVLWAFTELIARPNFKRLALAGAAYGLLALTHHATFFTFTPFLMLYIAVGHLSLVICHLPFVARRSSFVACGSLRNWFKGMLFSVGAGLLGLALASIYLLPAILEQRFIKVEQWTSGSYNFAQHFVYFSQFLSPFWGYEYAGAGVNDGMSYQLGIVVYGLLAFALVGLLRCHREMARKGMAIIFFGATLLAVWLMSPLAESVWMALPIASLVQFPWRLLIIAMLSASVAAGSLAASLRPDDTVLGITVLIVALGSYAYAQPQYTDIPDWADTPLAIINWDSASIQDRVGMVVYTDEQPVSSPMEAQYRAGEQLGTAAIIAGDASVEMLHHGGASDKVRVIGGPATLQFYTYDYPGWRVTLDGQPIPHRREPPYGLITVDVPPGDHTLQLRMGSTPARVIGGGLSLLALGIIGTGVFGRRRSGRRSKAD